MYAQYRCMKAMMCLELPKDTSASEGASCFVNPMTALGMVETMRAEGHTALVHTAAASNLGQMLNRLCIEEDIDLVNIVRKPEQEQILRDLGARVAAGLKTTFASHYSREISLSEALSVKAIAEYGKQATGEKFLINPQR